MHATTATETELPPKENFHLFLLAGQSNMAGRGKLTAEDQVPLQRVLTLDKDGNWVQAADPIHFDKRSAGVGPGRSFGQVLSQADEKITIGLIPAAVGGSPISSWQPGKQWYQTETNPYDDAAARTRRAMQDGTLKAVLWHQGEADGSASYADSLRALIARFREEFDNPELPVLIGQLGRFEGRPWTDKRIIIDRAHRAVAEGDPLVVYVSSEGLSALPDNLHFDAPSARELGKRYAAAYLELIQDEQTDEN